MNRSNPVYKRPLRRRALFTWALLGAALIAVSPAPRAQTGDQIILEARDAFRKKDGDRLAALRAAALAERHPLALWTDYWELNNRLATAQADELEAFYQRWPASYVEDRLRNDWLLELGQRRDWAQFRIDFPRFRMNDDREVTCYALLTEHLAGKDVLDAARAAWLAQSDADDGCALLAGTLFEAQRFTAEDVWRKTRHAIDANQTRAAHQAVMLIGPTFRTRLQQVLDNPARFLSRGASKASTGRNHDEMVTLALVRIAAKDPQAAADQLASRWERALPSDLAAWAWAAAGKQAALGLMPQAPDYFQRAQRMAGSESSEQDWPDEMLAWKARAALRANDGAGRWQQVVQAVNAMSEDEQHDPAWIYWKARALQALASDSQEGAALRVQARDLLAGIASHFSFYGKLAAETLGRTLALPPAPAPLSAAERAAAAVHPGLTHGLRLIELGLRSEGVREWNFSLRGMDDRQLLAAAQRACEREVWDRCINTSDRTRTEIDLQQRFPMPFRNEVVAQAEAIGLDPAYVYGLIRQESRFIMDARSSAGASGLMQLMPATARWTARKIGLDYSPRRITDRDTNLKLGTSYLKLMLDEFGGSQAMAAAAYNAGPGRPRRWREGPVLEPAVWAENIPFSETRNYVKKVLSNATYYAALLTHQPPSLEARLGASIGPQPEFAASNAELP